MSAFTDAVLTSWKASRDLFGCQFTVAGINGTFTGIMRQTDDLIVLLSGGIDRQFAGGLEYLPAEVAIAKGARVTIAGTTYRVEQIAGSAEDPVRVAILS